MSPDFPILGVAEVRIDGAVLASTAYRVDDDSWLVRIDGTSWPSRQDFSLATTEVGTWSVTLFAGALPPADGVFGAKALAGELYSGCSGGDCVLPANIRSRVSRGDSIEFIGPTDFADGKTGVRAADLFLQAVRLGDQTARTVVVSPDVAGSFRRTGT